MITQHKLNNRGYGNRPFKHYSGFTAKSDNRPVFLRKHPQLTPWYVRLWRWVTFR